MPYGLQGGASRGCKSSLKWSLQVDAGIYWYLLELECVIAKVSGSITGSLEDDFSRCYCNWYLQVYLYIFAGKLMWLYFMNWYLQVASLPSAGHIRFFQCRHGLIKIMFNKCANHTHVQRVQ